MSNIFIFTDKKAVNNSIVMVHQVKNERETVRILKQKIVAGKRFRNIFNDYDYVPVPVGSYIITDIDDNELSMTFEVLRLYYQPLGGVEMGRDGLYQTKVK